MSVPLVARHTLRQTVCCCFSMDPCRQDSVRNILFPRINNPRMRNGNMWPTEDVNEYFTLIHARPNIRGIYPDC
jgi:hypothetical protein